MYNAISLIDQRMQALCITVYFFGPNRNAVWRRPIAIMFVILAATDTDFLTVQ